MLFAAGPELRAAARRSRLWLMYLFQRGCRKRSPAAKPRCQVSSAGSGVRSCMRWILNWGGSRVGAANSSRAPVSLISRTRQSITVELLRRSFAPLSVRRRGEDRCSSIFGMSGRSGGIAKKSPRHWKRRVNSRLGVVHFARLPLGVAVRRMPLCFLGLNLSPKRQPPVLHWWDCPA